MKSSKLLIGILVGISAGALLGILVAPEKGSDTRKKIVKKSDEFTDAVKEKFNGLIDSINEKINHVKEETDEFVEQEKKKINKVKEVIKTAKS